MKTKFIALIAVLILPVSAYASEPGAASANVTSAKRPNILFIAIDDLRPELGCYGSEIAISPNLDKLAGAGLLFNRAYCQEAICCPSRASLMTGARPDTIGIVENATKFRDLNPDIVTLSQHFIANGYEAVQCGKIFHNPDHSDPEFSWNREPSTDKLNLPAPTGSYALPENQAIWKKNNERLEAQYGKGIAQTGLVQGPAYESADVPDQAYRDGYNADLAIATMKEIAAEGKPFFMGLGFYKPHLDFIAPKRYWDLYDPAKIPLTTQTVGPTDGAAMGLHPSFELRVRDGIPKSGPIDDELARKLKHAYLACVSYVDAQIGRVIESLDEAGLRENTIIIVWGDHGWHLGEMGIWGKATNYEIATRVPMMIWTPDMPAGSRGLKTDALVELVDIYPTLCELAGLPLPHHLEGTSFKPLLAEPNRKWETAAFSQFPDPALREWAANPLQPSMRETFFGPLIEEVEARIIAQQGKKWDRDLFENNLMGYTMRTDCYRLVVWKDVKNPNAEPIAVELYDHQNDPTETINIAAKEPDLVAKLLQQFNAGWKGNGPPIATDEDEESEPQTRLCQKSPNGVAELVKSFGFHVGSKVLTTSATCFLTKPDAGDVFAVSHQSAAPQTAVADAIETPDHPDQENPFTDPDNSAGWELNKEVSDEFSDSDLDVSKWLIQGRDGIYKSNWIGRAPSQFSTDNVRLEDGKLKLQSRWEPDFKFSDKLDMTFPDKEGQGRAYENITTAAVICKNQFLYGYMEIKCKAADASVTSSFWGTGHKSELDVFEFVGAPKKPGEADLDKRFQSNVIDWGRPKGSDRNAWRGKHILDWRPAGDFHVYGCEWSETGLKFYADGTLIQSVTKEELGEGWVMTKPLWIWVDSETFPWVGLPIKETLPADFEIEYIRVWQKNEKR